MLVMIVAGCWLLLVVLSEISNDGGVVVVVLVGGRVCCLVVPFFAITVFALFGREKLSDGRLRHLVYGWVN